MRFRFSIRKTCLLFSNYLLSCNLSLNIKGLVPNCPLCTLLRVTLLGTIGFIGEFPYLAEHMCLQDNWKQVEIVWNCITLQNTCPSLSASKVFPENGKRPWLFWHTFNNGNFPNWSFSSRLLPAIHFHLRNRCHLMFSARCWSTPVGAIWVRVKIWGVWHVGALS